MFLATGAPESRAVVLAEPGSRQGAFQRLATELPRELRDLSK